MKFGPARLVALMVVVLLLVSGGFWLVVRQQGGSLSLDTAPSSRLLSKLSDDAALAGFAAGPADHVPVDGTSPDIAIRDFSVQKPTVAREALVRACAAQKLHQPSADERRMLPEAVCVGQWEGKDATVLLFPSKCTATCRISLEVRVI